MRYRLGRLLQVIGLFVMPQGVVLNLLDRVSVGQSLLIALAGVAVFFCGVGLQRSAGS